MAGRVQHGAGAFEELHRRKGSSQALGKGHHGVQGLARHPKVQVQHLARRARLPGPHRRGVFRATSWKAYTVPFGAVTVAQPLAAGWA